MTLLFIKEADGHDIIVDHAEHYFTRTGCAHAAYGLFYDCNKNLSLRSCFSVKVFCKTLRAWEPSNNNFINLLCSIIMSVKMQFESLSSDEKS